jgi:ketosteroid isomerase-like protein
MATATNADGVFASYRDALQRNDEQGIVDAFADDAELISYSERNRPSSAQRLQGRAAIQEMMREIVSRNLKHTIEDSIVGEDRFAYTERCVYPTGEQVMTTVIAEVRDGRIARQVGVEAWDE